MRGKKLEDLKLELSQVLEVAKRFGVSHTEVASENDMGYSHLLYIRKGERLTVDNERNREVLSGIIKSYKNKLTEKKALLQQLD